MAKTTTTISQRLLSFNKCLFRPRTPSARGQKASRTRSLTNSKLEVRGNTPLISSKRESYHPRDRPLTGARIETEIPEGGPATKKIAPSQERGINCPQVHDLPLSYGCSYQLSPLVFWKNEARFHHASTDVLHAFTDSFFWPPHSLGPACFDLPPDGRSRIGDG